MNQTDNEPFREDPAKPADQAVMFANRLEKQYKHLRKWARRTGVTAYRLYDKDIPEIPLAVDLYQESGTENRFLHIALYERPYENTVQDVAYPGFALEQRIPVHSMLTVTGSTILDLFAMTPYYWKTPRSGAERLASLDTLTTELHFDFLVYRRAHA